ncbi:DNA helicase rad5, partial [Quaeritorhiza haematococci]
MMGDDSSPRSPHSPQCQELANLFPDLPIHKIKKLLSHANGDIARAVEIRFDGGLDLDADSPPKRKAIIAVEDVETKVEMNHQPSSKRMKMDNGGPILNGVIDIDDGEVTIIEDDDEDPNTASSPSIKMDASSSSTSSSSSSAPPVRTPSSNRVSKFPAYIGSTCVMAYSLTKGHGVVSEGDKLTLVLDSGMKSFSSGRGRKKHYDTPGRLNGGTKGPAIVRLRKVDGRGNTVEVGKFASDVNSFISKLMQLQLCTFTATVVDVPANLRLMDNIIVSIKCFLTKEAFVDKVALRKSYNEDDEQAVHDRKAGLSYIFKEVSLKPVSSASSIETLDITTDEESSLGSQSNGAASSQEATLTAMDLQQIYRKAQTLDKKLASAEPRPGMRYVLRDYQKQALAFLLAKEMKDSDSQKEQSMSPLWNEYSLPKKGGSFYFSPHSGQLSLEKPLEKHCYGGILADEMGLGKTIEMLALIHTNRPPPTSSTTPSAFTELMKSKGKSSLSSAQPDEEEERASNGSTLIVCPLNVLSQWRDEIEKCLGPDTTVEMYYGQDRVKKERHLFNRRDGANPFIVLTTYHTLASEFGEGGKEATKSPLFYPKWFRIVLDEAHYIKERSTKLAKACYALSAQTRWAITGTPIINKLEDLFSIVHFLRLEPWEQYSFWKAFVTVPFTRKDPKALELVQTIMEPIILRRTKDMKDANGEAIVSLPPKTITLEKLQFSTEEQEIYDKLFHYSKRRLINLKGVGKISYTSVFQLLLRLRQMCDHPYLLGNIAADENVPTVLDLRELLDKYYGDSEFAAHVAEDLESQENKECPICFETMDGGVLLPCLHVTCSDCIQDYLQKREQQGEPGECPVCRKECSEKDLLEIVKSVSKGAGPTSTSDIDNQPQPSTKINLRSANFRSSTKLNALIRILGEQDKEQKEAEEAGIVDSTGGPLKTVVFSQWTSFLDLIEVVLKEKGYEFVRLDGSLQQKQ